jgi:hypothetical protein
MHRIAFHLFLIAMVSSCDKNHAPALPASPGVYIINEGNFNFGNGEVSFYDPVTNELNNDNFQIANGYMLGDVAQSMFIKDSLGFIVVNNSQKIEVVKIPSLKKVGTIPMHDSNPRNFFPLNDSIAYVTELYAKKIWILNYKAGFIIGSISTDSWTEKIIGIGSELFVQQKILSTVPASFATLIRINTSANTAFHNNTFGGRDVNGMVKDKLNRIWIAVDEDTARGLYAGFYCFDRNLVEQKSFFFTSFNHHPLRLCVDSKGEKLFYADKDVYSFSIDDTHIPSTSLIQGNGANIYAMDIDPSTDDIYLSDALDFVQQSRIYRYDKDFVQQSRIYRYDKRGTLVHSFTAGIISGNFAFRHE